MSRVGLDGGTGVIVREAGESTLLGAPPAAGDDLLVSNGVMHTPVIDVLAARR